MGKARLQPDVTVAGASMRTSIGVVRPHNEDAAFVDGGQRYFVVADGMGGHSAGEIASAMAVAAVRDTIDTAASWLDELATSPDQRRDQHVRDLLERAVRAANERIYERSLRERDKHGMGTTIEVVLVLGDQAYIAHAGDSRTYHIRDGQAQQATVDHTVAQAMVEAGSITAEEAAHSPMRSSLCNAVGIGTRLRVDHVQLTLCPGDALLVCTDGLYEYFESPELGHRVSATNGDMALDGLIYEACARGGHDNVTGVVVSMGRAPRPQPVAPSPLATVPEDNLSAIVEHALRERSEPIAVPTEILLEY